MRVLRVGVDWKKKVFCGWVSTEKNFGVPRKTLDPGLRRDDSF
jgi:hypothetical protein